MQTAPRVPLTRVEVVTDDMHGHRIEDPYRWLENPDSAETVAWVEAQNAYTRQLLDRVPGRGEMRGELERLLETGSITAPEERNGRLFSMRREGTQNQPVLLVRDGPDGEERVLLDPNRESAEGIVTLDWWYPSLDGRLLAYGYSSNGDEWSTLYVLDVESGVTLRERIERTRTSSVAWLPDGSGLYYTRYPHPGEVPQGEESYHKRLFFHRLGTDPVEDGRVEITEMEPEDLIAVSISRDGRYLLATIFKGWERSDVYIKDRSLVDAPFAPVAVGLDALFACRVVAGTLYLHTNLDAPRYRLLRADPAHPEQRGWQEVVPESPDAVLESVTFAGGRLAVQYLRNAVSSLSVLDASGSRLYDVDLPVLGTLTEVRGQWESEDVFYAFQSFTLPPTVYQLDIVTGETRVWDAVEAPVRAEDYLVTQEWYRSRDGTPVSMFLVHRRDIEPGTLHPTLLTGYGGFNISRTPLFVRGAYLWLEHGGIYALPNLRGGGEYGEAWHRAGMLSNKQNVFDDFISAAEHLIQQGYTDPDHLAIAGGSNGGLLVGAAMTQRPDLFRAVVCSVPLLDMLRYHRFLIARLWIPEYGSADDPGQFPFLHAYSPYHHVRQGERYPAVLFTTAESDTRVDPMHARKMTALMQAATSSDRPILLRLETRAGHGIGKPLAKVIEEQTDFWSFLVWQVGLKIET